MTEFMTPWLEVGRRHPNRGAQALYRDAVYPTVVPGFLAVRWFSVSEIQFVLAEHYDKLLPLTNALYEHKFGEDTRLN